MEILSIEEIKDDSDIITQYIVFISSKNNYERYIVGPTTATLDSLYPKKDYRNYEHFVGVMGKFDPYTAFFPAEPLDELDFESIKMHKTN